jgi:hypothetical protein
MKKIEAERSRFIRASERGNCDRSASQHPLFENHISTTFLTHFLLCVSSSREGLD